MTDRKQDSIQGGAKDILVNERVALVAAEYSSKIPKDEKYQSVRDLFMVSAGSREPQILQLAYYGHKWKIPGSSQYGHFSPEYISLMYEIIAQNVKAVDSGTKDKLGQEIKERHSREGLGVMMKRAHGEPIRYWFNDFEVSHPQEYTIGLISSLRRFGAGYAPKNADYFMQEIKPLTDKIAQEGMTMDQFFSKLDKVVREHGTVKTFRGLCAGFKLYQPFSTFTNSPEYMAAMRYSPGIVEKIFKK